MGPLDNLRLNLIRRSWLLNGLAPNPQQNMWVRLSMLDSLHHSTVGLVDTISPNTIT
jgi:hypothetical protein